MDYNKTTTLSLRIKTTHAIIILNIFPNQLEENFRNRTRRQRHQITEHNYITLHQSQLKETNTKLQIRNRKAKTCFFFKKRRRRDALQKIQPASIGT